MNNGTKIRILAWIVSRFSIVFFAYGAVGIGPRVCTLYIRVSYNAELN
jgi:hypothetical protein